MKKYFKYITFVLVIFCMFLTSVSAGTKNCNQETSFQYKGKTYNMQLHFNYGGNQDFQNTQNNKYTILIKDENKNLVNTEVCKFDEDKCTFKLKDGLFQKKFTMDISENLNNQLMYGGIKSDGVNISQNCPDIKLNVDPNSRKVSADATGNIKVEDGANGNKKFVGTDKNGNAVNEEVSGEYFKKLDDGVTRVQRKVIGVDDATKKSVYIELGSMCSKDNVRAAFRVFGYLLVVVKILIPIGLIIFGSINFIKAVMSGNADELKKRTTGFAFKMIAAVVIFVLPTIIYFILGLVDNYEEGTDIYVDCKTCIFDVSKCK